MSIKGVHGEHDGPAPTIHDPRYEREKMQPLIEALEFYADPATYHALAIWADPPCGDFVNDYSDDHGDEFYDRPMPGKTAREALALLEEKP